MPKTFMVPAFVLVQAESSDDADLKVAQLQQQAATQGLSMLLDEGLPSKEVKDASEAEYHSILDVYSTGEELLDALVELQKQIRAHHRMQVKKDYSLMVADAQASKAIENVKAARQARQAPAAETGGGELQYHLVALSSDIVEDSFQEGEGKSTGCGYHAEPVGKTFPTMKEMLGYLAAMFGLPENPADYEIEEGRLMTSKTVANHTEAQNCGWFEASAAELAAWKNGAMKLYSENFSINFVRCA